MKKIFYGVMAMAIAAVSLSACASDNKTEENKDSEATEQKGEKKNVVNDTVNAAVKKNITPETPDSDMVYSVDVEKTVIDTINGKVQDINEVEIQPEGAQ